MWMTFRKRMDLTMLLTDTTFFIAIIGYVDIFLFWYLTKYLNLRMNWNILWSKLFSMFSINNIHCLRRQRWKVIYHQFIVIYITIHIKLKITNDWRDCENFWIGKFGGYFNFKIPIILMISPNMFPREAIALLHCQIEHGDV